jgi:N-acetylglucosamine-6-phosphate deacetylase
MAPGYERPVHLKQTEAYCLIDDAWLAMRCVHDAHIHQLEPISGHPALPHFIPAPVDLHVHGGGGADVMQGPAAIVQVLQSHARHGTGALLATSVTAEPYRIEQFLTDVSEVMTNPPPDGALLLGAHLEGPFINPDKLGAQPAHAVKVDKQMLERWFSSKVVKIITYAPEQDPDFVVPPLCELYCVKMQIGHTLCSWGQANRVIAEGAGVTHLYNAMSGVSHRCGGAATAALAYAQFAEIITDGIHVDQAAFQLARRSIPGLYSVTDATAAAGMPDGMYSLGELDIEKRGDSVFLPDGTLAGSCLTQRRSFAVLTSWGLNWIDIARLCSASPAIWLGHAYLGMIKKGATANWLELSDDGVVALWLRGQRFSLESTQE